MKTNPVRLHTIKEMTEAMGHTGNIEGLQVLLGSPEQKKMVIQYPFRTDSYWILLVMDDSIVIQLNGEEKQVDPNSVLIVPPHAIRQAVKKNGTPKVACVAFTPDFMLNSGLSQRHLDLFYYFFNSRSTQLQLGTEEATHLMSVIGLLEGKNFPAGDHAFATEVIRHFFNAFQFELAGLYHKYSNQEKRVHDHKEEILWGFLALLSKHVKTERSLQFYANQLYVTPKYLTQTVKKLSGKTAGKYIDELVIVEAKNFLRDPSLSIAQVADLLYFSDQFFFSKFFKRYTGITPSDFRKSM